MPDMIPGKLADYHRDVAWYGKDADERQATTAYKPTHHSETTKPESAEKRQEREDLDYARLDGGDAERGRQARGAGAARQAAEMAEDKKKRDKEAVDRAELMLLQAQQAAAYYGAIADGLEAEFEKEYGPQWREHMGLEILGEDEMPLRRDGESMEDYNARVEQALMDKLLNEDGSVKDEYKDHPKYGKWGDWAQSRFKQRDIEAKAGIAADETQPAEIREKALADLEGLTNSAELREANQELRMNGIQSDVIAEKTDDLRSNEAQLSSDAGASAFGLG